MYSYSAYGVGIYSELLIPELVQTDVLEDVRVELIHDGNLDIYRTPKVDERKWDLDLDSKSSVFFIDEVGVFLISDGNRIKIIPAPSCSEQTIRLYLLGTVMSILLYQRGLLVLHGSVVEIGQRAAIFLGASGAGKSTTTAALQANGHRILADDIAAIDPSHSPVMVAAGSPQIKLGTEVIETLGYESKTLHPLHSLKGKKGYRFHNDFSLKALPVHRIYVLTFGSEFCISALKPQDAVIELVRHSRPTTLKFCGGAHHFLQCAQLAKVFPVYRLERPRSIEMLPQFSKFVEVHSLEQELVKPKI